MSYSLDNPSAQGTWRCAGAETGTKFDEVDLNESEWEWVDYDEKVGFENQIRTAYST
jgi:hypothetical protein